MSNWTSGVYFQPDLYSLLSSSSIQGFSCLVLLWTLSWFRSHNIWRIHLKTGTGSSYCTRAVKVNFVVCKCYTLVTLHLSTQIFARSQLVTSSDLHSDSLITILCCTRIWYVHGFYRFSRNIIWIFRNRSPFSLVRTIVKHLIYTSETFISPFIIIDT